MNELLGLEKLGYTASLLVGYRHDEDATQYYKKLENHKKIYLSQYNY
jgi:hypothetical protein